MTDFNGSKPDRINVIDALRGFAVMAILLVHSVEHFIYFSVPNPASQPAWLNILDSGTFSIIFSLFAGKSYAIFALLFGLTYYIQFSNRQRKGSDFCGRFMWRLLLLAGFACINAAFFPGGDVLLLFSIVGGILALTRNWSSKAILILAVVCLLQPIEWFHYMHHLLSSSYEIHAPSSSLMYAQVNEAVKSGNWLTMFGANLTTGQGASLLWAIDNGRFTQTAGLFLIGYLLGKHGVFVDIATKTKFWVGILIISAIAFCPLHELKVQLLNNQELEIIKRTAGITVDMWQKLAFAGVLVSSFVLLYHYTAKFRAITEPLRYYGKMSLTNYLTQSVIGALVYFPVGLHLAPRCGYFFSLLIGIATLILQIMFCKWWLSTHKQGPLEGLWHKLTWLNSK